MRFLWFTEKKFGGKFPEPEARDKIIDNVLHIGAYVLDSDL